MLTDGGAQLEPMGDLCRDAGSFQSVTYDALPHGMRDFEEKLWV